MWGMPIRSRPAGSATFGFDAERVNSPDLDLPERAPSGQVDVELAGGGVVGREGDRQQPALALGRVRVPVRSRNGVAWTTPPTISRTSPAFSVTKIRVGSLAGAGRVRRRRERPERDERGRGRGRRGAHQQEDQREREPHPRTRTVRDTRATFPAASVARTVSATRSDECRRNGARTAAAPREVSRTRTTPRLPRSSDLLAVRNVATPRTRARTDARHASSARNAIVSRLVLRTLRTPVTRADNTQARVSAGGAAGPGALDPHADGAPSTNLQTGPASDTTRMRPHASSPNEPAKSPRARPRHPSPGSPGGPTAVPRSRSRRRRSARPRTAALDRARRSRR